MLFHHWLSQGLILGYTREVIFRLRQKTGKTVGHRPRTYVWLFRERVQISVGNPIMGNGPD